MTGEVALGPPRASAWRTRLGLACWFPVAALAAGEAAATLAPAGVLAAAFEAGRWGLLLASAALAAAGLTLKRRRLAWVALFFVGLHAVALRPVPAADTLDPAGPPAWRLLHANLGDEPGLDALAAWLASLPPGERPDAVSLQELRPGQMERIDAALPGYAAAWTLERRDSRGGGLWLRGGVTPAGLVVRGLPSTAAAAEAGGWLEPDDPAARPLVDVELHAGDARPPLRLVLSSAARPSSAARHATRNAELYRLTTAGEVDPDGPATAWAGDLNAPPWSRALRTAAADSGMRLASPVATWPAWAGPLGLPIDLCLVSPGVRAEAEAGPDLGSDHRSLVVRVQPPPAP